jgi:hypothetical protein
VHVVGIHTQVKDGRAIVRVVVLVASSGKWVEHEKFTHTCDRQEDRPLQMMNLAHDLPHRLSGLDIESAVLRDRDHSSGGVKVEQLKVDFTADGVVLAALRERCPKTALLHGNEIGRLCGSDKATAESAAAADFGSVYKEAGSAARAAIRLV